MQDLAKEKEFNKVPLGEGVCIAVNENVPMKQVIRYNIPQAFQDAVTERLKKKEKRGIIERADGESCDI